MYLKKMVIRDFMGFRGEFVFYPDGEDINVYGENGTRKTTLLTAFRWCLFGVNYAGDSQFHIKPRDEHGDVIHGLDSIVEITLGDVYKKGDSATWRRTYHEDWTKRRGTDEERWTGHSTDFEVEGVRDEDGEVIDGEVTKSLYQDLLELVLEERMFQLLSNPRFFAEELHWTERKEVLMDMCEDISFENVIAENPELEPLAEAKGERSVENHEKVLKDRQSDIDDRLDEIKIQIPEAERAIPDEVKGDEEKLEKKKARLKTQIKEAKSTIDAVDSGGEVSNKEAELARQETEIEKARSAAQSEASTKASNLREDASEKEEQARRAGRSISRKEGEVEDLQEAVSGMEDDIDELRDAFGLLPGSDDIQEAESGEEIIQLRDALSEAESAMANALGTDFESLGNLPSFAWDSGGGECDVCSQGLPESPCPGCGQSLPEQQVEETIQKAKRSFAARVATRKKEINDRGKALKTKEVPETKAKIEDLQGEIRDLRAKKNEAEAEAKRLREEADSVEPDLSGLEPLQERKAEIEQEIKSLKAEEGQNKAKQEAEERKAKLEKQLQTVTDRLSDHQTKRRQEKRKQELSDERKELGAEYEKVEDQLSLISEFRRAKTRLMKVTMEGLFELAEFQLVEEQVNGGTKDTCEVLCDGVPFKSANNGGRIRVGMDIIRTLQDYYDVEVPVWVDNAESVTSLPEMDCQTIRLVVMRQEQLVELGLLNEGEEGLVITRDQISRRPEVDPGSVETTKKLFD